MVIITWWTHISISSIIGGLPTSICSLSSTICCLTTSIDCVSAIIGSAPFILTLTFRVILRLHQWTVIPFTQKFFLNMNLLGSDIHLKSGHISIHVCDNTCLSFQWTLSYHYNFIQQRISSNPIRISLAHMRVVE